MSHPQASSAVASTSTVPSQESMLNGLYTLPPASDSKRMALQLLLDAKYYVCLSLNPDSPLLNGSAMSDAKLLAIAKYILLRHLNPAWHPILEDCEHQMSNFAECGSHTDPERFSIPTADDSMISESLGSNQDSPYSLADNVPCSGEDVFYTPIPPPLPGASSVEVFDEVPQALNPRGSGTLGNQSMFSCFSSVHGGKISNLTSTYSSLLPEHHCPPYVGVDDDNLGFSSPKDCITPCASSLLSPREDRRPQAAQGWIPPGIESRNESPAFLDLQTLFSADQFENIGPLFEDHTQSLPRLQAPSLIPSDFSNLEQTSISPLPQYPRPHNPEEQGDPGSSKKKQRRRAFDRPPGLPLGPWKPNDPPPFPEDLPPRKPRNVRRAPFTEPISNTSEDRGKISCPECNTLLLPKSLSRHLERHSNWTNGRYDAHLFCRYCFSAYSRMDSLIYHQKTDLQCVQLQYKIYWRGRQAYLKEALRVWQATLDKSNDACT